MLGGPLTVRQGIAAKESRGGQYAYRYRYIAVF